MSDEVLFGMWDGLACGVCQRKATHYAVRELAPEPPSDLDAPFIRVEWYVCPDHVRPWHVPVLDLERPPVCENCGEPGASWVPSQTAYETSLACLNVWQRVLRAAENPPNPNRDPALCEGCAGDYTSYYEERWQDYYSSR